MAGATTKDVATQPPAAATVDSTACGTTAGGVAETTPGAKEHEVPGSERYAAFGLRLKQIFAVKAKLASAKAAAVSAKVKTIAAANARYTAYSSDVGEALRPIVPQWAVRGSYGLAIAYIMGDVAYTGHKESLKPDGNATRAIAHAAVFQGVASLALPMVIIHQAVHAAQYATKRLGRFTKWGPTICGLALIPALPFAVDEPCEHVIDRAFDELWPTPGSKHAHADGSPSAAAVGSAHPEKS